jgi:hypothetical protein
MLCCTYTYNSKERIMLDSFLTDLHIDHVVVGLGAAAVSMEIIGKLITGIIPFPLISRGLIALTSVTAVTLISMVLIYLPFTTLSEYLSSNEGSSFEGAKIRLFIQFTCAFFAIHFLGYCFSGAFHSLSSKYAGLSLWPKILDYPYYALGSYLLIGILANLYKQEEAGIVLSEMEVMFGVYLLNLKIFKTSYEVFPESWFRHRVGWVRDPFTKTEIF